MEFSGGQGKVIERKRLQFSMPGIGTCVLDDVREEILSGTGWSLEAVIQCIRGHNSLQAGMPLRYVSATKREVSRVKAGPTKSARIT